MRFMIIRALLVEARNFKNRQTVGVILIEFFFGYQGPHLRRMMMMEIDEVLER